MTTIIATRTHMYADSACESDGLLTPMEPKIRRVNGSLVGFAGIREEGLMFLDWLAAGQPQDKKPQFKEFAGLQVTQECIVLWDNMCVPMPLPKEQEWWALGSGRKVAIGAMAAGADPARAMEIALIYDGGSRPPVTILPLRQLEAAASA